MAVSGNTLVQIFINRVAKTPDLVALKSKRNGQWQSVTFKGFDIQAREIANGLLSLGIETGSCVGLLSGNRPEWQICDVATLLAGGVTVPVYVTNSAGQVAYILSHSESTAAFVEDSTQLDKILDRRRKIPKLKTLIVFEPVETDAVGVMSIEDLKSKGREYMQSHPAALQERIDGGKPGDTATIVYTSGTTGDPKGAMLSHGGFAWTLDAIAKVLPFGDGQDRVLSYLPLSHIFERLNSVWGGIYFGMEVWFAESIEKLLDNLKECQPTFFIGVPRVFEKFHIGLKAKIETHEKRHLIERAVEVGLQKVEAEQQSKPVPLGVKAKYALLNKLVLSKLREGLGMGKLRFAVTGGAPIEPEIMRFIRAIGIELVEGYGQTEDNAPTAVTAPGKVRIGAVGPPIPGLELKFDSDGELLVRGPNVFKGYFKDEQATKDALTEDGFLRTGDVGELDEAGYLRITDRKKDLIKTAGGKYIAPQLIEGKLKFDPLIGQAVVIGDRRPFPTALLTLDEEYAAKWAEQQGIVYSGPEGLAEDPKIHEEVARIVDSVNQGLSHAEQIKKWKVLPRDFTQEDEEITPTLKIRRKIINEKYASEIEGLYS